MDNKLKALQKQIAALNESMKDLAGTKETMLFSQAALHWLLSKQANPTIRESTKKIATNQVMNHLIPWFGKYPLDKISNDLFMAWIVDKRLSHPDFKFLNSRKYLGAILRAAQSEGLIDKTPKLDNPDHKEDIGRILSDSEVIRILWKSRKPFRFMFYCFWKTGCRPSEICQWEFTMFRNDMIHIPARITKTDRDRKIPSHAKIVSILKHRKPSIIPFIFPNVNWLPIHQKTYSNEWNRACKKAGIKAVPYDLRRSFITRCVSEGKSTIFIAKLLDTSAKIIEEKYCKNDEKTMRDLLK